MVEKIYVGNLDGACRDAAESRAGVGRRVMSLDFAAIHPAERRRPTPDGATVRSALLATGAITPDADGAAALSRRPPWAPPASVRLDDRALREAAREILATTPPRALERVIAQASPRIAEALRRHASRAAA